MLWLSQDVSLDVHASAAACVVFGCKLFVSLTRLRLHALDVLCRTTVPFGVRACWVFHQRQTRARAKLETRKLERKMTFHVVTRSYRAPEVILCQVRHWYQ